MILVERAEWHCTAVVRLSLGTSCFRVECKESTRTPLRHVHYAAVFGPAATTWFGFLQRRINLQSQNLTILARVLTDQTVFASTNLFCFLSSMAILEGSDPKKKLEGTYWEALKKNWMVWPAVQAINFKFVPLEHRVMVVNVVALGESKLLAAG